MSFGAFIYSQLFVTPPYPKANLAGQTFIVTGANVGLGLEAARHVTRMGAEKVILAVRNLEKGDAAKKSIEESTGRTGIVDVWQLDLTSYESVKTFAKRAQGLKRLDTIIENAGIATEVFRTAEDCEAMITTNVISTYLLALMILPKLRETAQKFNVTPHLTIISSEVHGWTSFPERNEPDLFQALGDKEKARMAERYPLSKLLEVLYTRALVEQTEKSGKPKVIMNLVNPGLCHSELARDLGWGLYFMKLLLARTTEVGSRTLVHGGTDAGAESNGQYLDSCRVAPPAAFVTSAEGVKAQEKVWQQLSKKLESIQPGIMQNV